MGELVSNIIIRQKKIFYIGFYRQKKINKK